VKKSSLILAGSLIISTASAGYVSKTAGNTISTYDAASNKIEQTGSEITGQNAKVPQWTNKSDTEKVSNFEIITKTYVNKNVKIKYPQIINFSDADKQKQINDLIKNDIINDYQKDVSRLVGYAFDTYKEAEAGLTEDVNYYIKLNSPKLLSVLYVKNASIPKSAHPNNYVHSINIDIEKGNTLKFKDFINIDDSFVEKLKNVKARIWIPKVLPGIEAADELNKELAGIISQGLNLRSNKDLIDQFSSEDYSFYFTKNNLGMTIDVPHFAGDYAELEIKYNDIKDNIKPENEVLP
jgi:hypothetical protein